METNTPPLTAAHLSFLHQIELKQRRQMDQLISNFLFDQFFAVKLQDFEEKVPTRIPP